MCIITNENHIVISISLIPGIHYIPDNFHVYWPWDKEIPSEGDYFNP
jgi:hypothetical protein